MKGMSNILAVIVAGVAIFALFYFVGPWLQTGEIPTGPSGPTQTECPDTTIYAQVAARNNLNSSLEYQAGSIVVTKSDGESVVASGTANVGTSKSYEPVTIPCSPETYNNGVYVYMVADAARASDKSSLLNFAGSTSVFADLVQEDTDQLTFIMYDTTLSNTSTPNTGSSGTVSEASATAMSAGDSRSGYIDAWQATGKAQYGSHHDGLLWCIDTVDSSAFTDDSISLSSQTSGFTLTPVDCELYSKTTSVDSCNICYKSRAIKATDSRIRLAWTMTNDGGSDCGATDDPVAYVEDIVYFEDTDSTVKVGTHDSSGTNKGETQCTITWANS